MLPCPDSLMPTASVLPMIRRAAVGETSSHCSPLEMEGGGGEERQLWDRALYIKFSLMVLRERSALLGM